MFDQRAILRVQCWIPEHEAADFLAVAARCGWPTKVGTVAGAHARRLCVGPADWLVIGAAMDAASLRQSIAAELAEEGGVIIDLSDALAIVPLQGENARAILSTGCGLDLHLDAFAAGVCARTRLANVPVVVDCRAPHEFDLYVARSYGSYLQTWLADAARAY